jgi:hypothetical protein
MAEYSYPLVQTVAADENVLFNNGSRACHKGFIQHRDDSGIFTLKGPGNSCRALYAVTFTGNIAISAGGTVEPISVALTYNGEALRNATATTTPAAIGDFFNVSITTFVEVPCGCCVSIAVENVSETTDIDVRNANIIFERIA